MIRNTTGSPVISRIIWPKCLLLPAASPAGASVLPTTTDSADGRAMTGIPGYDSSDPDELIFELVRTAADQAAWTPCRAGRRLQ